MKTIKIFVRTLVTDGLNVPMDMEGGLGILTKIISQISSPFWEDCWALLCLYGEL
ncbi:TPA: hypothetical protein TVE93_000356 [Streptococcus equi subsp. zooepidemicus]|nr:hypothetical protein [Streptococcus equi subsp. zooepidemicus]